MPAMPINGVDRLCLETGSIDDDAAFWERLGFTLTQRWGQDGRAFVLEETT